MKDSEKSIDIDCSQNCNTCTNNFNPLLAGIEIENRIDLDQDRSHINFNKGEYIFKKGQFPSGLYCLKKGKVMVTKSDHMGNTIVVNLQKEVTFIGISDYVSQKPYETECVALNEVEVCFIKQENIDKFISENKAFTKRLLKEIASQHNQSNNRLLSATKKHMSARLADALMELFQVFGEDRQGYLDVYLKRSELALLSNMSVSNAIRQLSEFQKMKLLQLKGKEIRILDHDQLLSESQLI